MLWFGSVLSGVGAMVVVSILAVVVMVIFLGFCCGCVCVGGGGGGVDFDELWWANFGSCGYDSRW